MIADGDLWREHRFFTMKHLKNAGLGGGSMQDAINRELVHFHHIISEEMLKKGFIWPGPSLVISVMNVLWTFVAGSQCLDKKNKNTRNLLKLLDQRSKAFDFSGGLLADMPWLRFVAPEFSGYNLMCRFNEEIRVFFQKIIGEHYETYSEDKADDDLIYSFIREMKNHQEQDQEHRGETTFTDTQLMMVMLDLFLGGSHTTSVTLDLALMTLDLYEEIQDQIHAEVTAKTVDGNFLTISHHHDLPLTEAYLMEVARFYSIVPLSGPRRVLQDTILCGYNIPKNTTALIGLEFMHKNQEYWGDPESFRPNRFLNEDHTECRMDDHLVQFGQGRRQCLGQSMAKAFIFTFFTSIVKDFKVSACGGEEKPSTNLMSGIFKSPKPYFVNFTRRSYLE